MNTMNSKTVFFSAVVIMATFLSSCRSNTIYFDLSAQTINTCNDAPITSLFFTKSDSKEYGTYYKLDGRAGTSHFEIHQINSGYMFDEGSSDKVFSFDANSDFLIKNSSNGDAASAQIELKTDSNGKVIFASKTECN